MRYRKLIYFTIILGLVSAGFSEDDNYKEYFPGPNGEKPAVFIYSFSKDYELERTDVLKFFEKIHVFAEQNSMYEGEQTINSGGLSIKHYVAGLPMKFLLRVENLGGLRYRVQISHYPGRACSLCNAFIKEVDSTISGAD